MFDATLTGPQEYLDRRHDTVCAACFEAIAPNCSNDDAEKFILSNIGRRFISPLIRDCKTKLPIVMVITGASWFHVMSKGMGSIIIDKCFFEIA